MKKLRLEVEELAVESFSTQAAARGAGTVRGRDASLRCGTTDACTENSCGQGTCYPSCDILCGSYKCGGDTYGGATCDIYGCGTGGTSCNQPCVYTCDGAASCNAANTCIQTCYGLNTCAPNC